jgi:hypothetical protein
MEFALPKDAFRGGHCGVQAVAVAAGKSLNECFNLFRQHCDRVKRKRRWCGGTHYSEREKVLNAIGIQYEVLPQSHTEGMTMQRFMRDVANPNHVYMVTTTGHVQLVRGNQVLDQGGIKDIADHWGKRKRISRPVMRILAAEVAEAFDIAEAQTFGLPLFDNQGEK